MDIDQNFGAANAFDRAQGAFRIIFDCCWDIWIVCGERELHFNVAIIDLDRLHQSDRAAATSRRTRGLARGSRPSSGSRVRKVLPLESVPNFSEGRDRDVIDAIGAALSQRARLLDVHADAGPQPLRLHARRRRCRARGSARRRRRVRARAHRPAPARGRPSPRRCRGRRAARPDLAGDMERAEAAAPETAGRIGELGLPVFLYGGSRPWAGVLPAWRPRGASAADRRG